MKTSEIEGEYLDRDSVQSSIKKKFGIKIEAKSKVMEHGIAELMMDCFENFETALKQETLCKWHEMVCRDREDLKDIGTYRTHEEPMQVVSGQIDRPKIHFIAPSSSVVKKEMEEFFDWMNTSKLPPLTLA
jgi:Fic family protein